MSNQFRRDMKDLDRILGAELTAYIAKDSAAGIAQWSAGTRPMPTGELRERLRIAAHVARMVSKTKGAIATARWFQELHEPVFVRHGRMEDGSLSRMQRLRDESMLTAGPHLLEQARKFAAK